MGEANKINSYTEFFYKAFRNILIIGIPLVIISAIVLSSLHSSATNSGSDNLAITISSSCTLSSVVNIPHNAEVYNGNYLEDIGKTIITTLCNDGNGYTVYATGYSNNEVGNNKLINTTNSQYSIDTGLATSGLTSQWAVKLNNLENDPSSTPPIIESAFDDTYGLVPNNWTKVASRPSGTTDMNLGSSFTTTYSIYTSSSQFAGTYRGQVKYALLHPYSNNNTPSFNSFDQAFAFYKKEKVTIPDVGSYYAMQDMDNNICGLTNVYNEASAAQLADIRDNKLYWVAKLDDGNCWMTQNLDLDLDPTKPLTSNDTDLTDHSLTGAYANSYNYNANTGVITWTPAASAETIDFQNTESIANWSGSNTAPYSANKTDSVETGHMSLGNYYNWTVAIASNDSSSLTINTNNDTTNNPQNSICPKGWRLPTISSQSQTTTGSTNEFMRLVSLYPSIANSPLFFFKAGFINASSQLNTNFGLYWSSTIDGINTSYTLQNTANASNNKAYGSSIRCLAR